MKKGLFSLGIFLFIFFSNSILLQAFCGGTGTSNDPYLICTWDDLNEIRYKISSQNYFLLKDNLDTTSSGYLTYNSVSGKGWTPIKNFQGNFNGGGNFILGLLIRNKNMNYAGLIGSISESGKTIISNLTLKEVNISGGMYTGSLIGGGISSYGIAIIQNCSSSGTVIGDANTGGLVGYLKNGFLNDSSFYGKVSGYSITGGLIGYLENGSLDTSFFSGEIYNQYDCVGGLVGRSSYSTLENSFFSGKISTRTAYEYVGGLIGILIGGEVSSSFSYGIFNSSSPVGGLFGSNYNSSMYKPNFWDKEISGINKMCGKGSNCDDSLGKTTLEMKSLSTFNEWNICIGEKNLNYGYPYLGLQGGKSDCIWYINSKQSSFEQSCDSIGGYCSPKSIGNANIKEGSCPEKLSCYFCKEGYEFDSNFNCVKGIVPCVSGYISYWNISSEIKEWTYSPDPDFSEKIFSCNKYSGSCCPNNFICKDNGECSWNPDKSLKICSNLFSYEECQENPDGYAESEFELLYESGITSGENLCNSTWIFNSSLNIYQKRICFCSWQEGKCKAISSIDYSDKLHNSKELPPSETVLETTIIEGGAIITFGDESESFQIPNINEFQLPFFEMFNFILALFTVLTASFFGVKNAA